MFIYRLKYFKKLNKSKDYPTSIEVVEIFV